MKTFWFTLELRGIRKKGHFPPPTWMGHKMRGCRNSKDSISKVGLKKLSEVCVTKQMLNFVFLKTVLFLWNILIPIPGHSNITYFSRSHFSPTSLIKVLMIFVLPLFCCCFLFHCYIIFHGSLYFFPEIKFNIFWV